MTFADREVVRLAKAVYTHLKLRDRISRLSCAVHNLPAEAQKMQTLYVTDKDILKKAVRDFLQWKPSNGTSKSLESFNAQLDEAIMTACNLTEDLLEEEVETPSSTSSSSSSFLHKRAANEACGERAAKKRAYSNGSCASFSPPTPPLSPYEPLGDIHDGKPINVLCSPKRRIKCIDEAPWPAVFELARFMTQCHVDWHELTFEALQRFMDTAKTEPRKLYEEMMKWYELNKKSSTNRFAIMDRCSEYVWHHLERNTINIDKTRMIHFSAQLALVPNQPPSIQLRPPKVNASNRFFRKYGEDRFLELKLSRLANSGLIRQFTDYFLRPFVLMGRTFRFLFIKDDVVILFATDGPGLEPISIRQVIDWHIPILENWDMPISKFASRMSLGYSNSIPTLTFAAENIRYIEDIYSGAYGDEETCMTDGCGLISISAMRKIMNCEKTDELPCAVQGRIGGAKGIWIVAPDLDFNQGDWISIRKSQLKFTTGLPQFDMTHDPHHYTFDLVKNAICIYPSSLNTQFIQCLSSGGVPTQVFIDLLREYLDRLTHVVAQNHNVRILRDWIDKTGNIMRARWELENTEKDTWRDPASHADDYVECRSNDEDPLETPLQRTNDDYWRVNTYSGMPAAMYETAVRMLDSGFDLSNPYLATKVTNMFRDVMRSVTTKYKIEVEQSCTVTCIADPTGKLEPGQVFLQLSSRKKDEKTGIRANIIIGDVIVTRNPCGLKSDVQKVKAVDCEELRIYTDVIIFPIKGERSLASMLSGGDYDGDIVFCCWDQRIVEPFVASPVPPVPEAMEKVFDKNKTKVQQELSKTRDEAGQELALQKAFISVALPDGTLGIYENWRTVLAEKVSLDDPDVIYLAHMCAKLVDAPKQGLALKQPVLIADRRKFAKIPQPAWFVYKRNKQREKTFKSYQETNKDIVANHGPPVTTMDHLHEIVLNEIDTFTKYSRSIFAEDDVKFKDPDLSQPWMEAWKFAEESGDQLLIGDLERIQHAIDAQHEQFVNDCKDLLFAKQNRTDSRYDPSRAFDPFLSENSDFINMFELEEFFAREFFNIPSAVKSTTLKLDIQVNGGKFLSTLKASYAYIHSMEKQSKYSRYCYIVAFDTLRRLKADARAKAAKQNGTAESLVPYMYTAMSLNRSWVRRLKESKSNVDCGAARVRLVFNSEEKEDKD